MNGKHYYLYVKKSSPCIAETMGGGGASSKYTISSETTCFIDT